LEPPDVRAEFAHTCRIYARKGIGHNSAAAPGRTWGSGWHDIKLQHDPQQSHCSSEIFSNGPTLWGVLRKKGRTGEIGLFSSSNNNANVFADRIRGFRGVRNGRHTKPST